MADDDVTYRVVRYRRQQEPEREVLVRGLSLEQAQEHCNRPDTKGDDWFDGYEREE